MSPQTEVPLKLESGPAGWAFNGKGHGTSGPERPPYALSPRFSRQGIGHRRVRSGRFQCLSEQCRSSGLFHNQANIPLSNGIPAQDFGYSERHWDLRERSPSPFSLPSREES